MEVSFDHLIHAVRRPEDARLTFEQHFGIKTVQGGEHPQWGTYNALAYFGLSYVEWIGLRDEVKARETEFGSQVVHQLSACEGAVQFALRTQDIEGVAGAWRSSGLAFNGPILASRQRPDGSTLRWKMLFPEQQGVFDFKFPFLIQWEEDDHQRMRDLTASGVTSDEKPYQLRAVHSVVRDVGTFRDRWNTYYDIPAVSVRDDTYGPGAVIRVSDVSLYFWTPSTEGQRARVASVGEAPFRVDLAACKQSICQPGNERELHGLTVRIV